MSRSILLSAFLALAGPGLATAQCGGNGGVGDLASDPMALGTLLNVRVGGGAGAPFGLFLSPTLQPFSIPGYGPVCINLFDPLFTTLAEGALSPAGGFAFPVAVPNDPALLSVAVFLQAAVADPGHPSGLAISPALRGDFELPGSYGPRAPFSVPRALGTASLLADGRVLIAGGGDGSILSPAGTASSELYDPVSRTLSAGPSMAASRAFHTATTLPDGRVLLAGGIGDSLGNGTASCEIFHPASGQFLAAGPMTVPRAGHGAALLQDGRVLVCGGIPSFVGGSTNLGAVLNAAWNTGEVYDPAADVWTPVQNAMGSPRFLPAVAILPSGAVLVASGINGATNLFGQAVPSFTATCDYYAPAANSFAPAPGIGSGAARAGASTALLPSGDLLIAGGVVSGLLGVPAATDTTRIFTTGMVFAAGPALPAAAALPGVALLSSGKLLIAGGVNGTLLAPTATASAAVFDGTSMTSIPPLPAARGGHVVVRMKDGGVFIGGGGDSNSTAQADTWVLTPGP